MCSAVSSCRMSTYSIKYMYIDRFAYTTIMYYTINYLINEYGMI